MLTKLRRIKPTSLARKLATFLLLCISILVLTELYIYYIRPNLFTNSSSSNTIQTPEELPTGEPDYETVKPAGKDISSSDGWKIVSPSKSEPVYAFADKLDGVSIIISQQLLPENLKDDTGEAIKRLAEDFNATSKIVVGSTTVYIGTSSDGPQSVIFTMKGLLVLIKSDSKIDSSKWKEYIATFQ